KKVYESNQPHFSPNGSGEKPKYQSRSPEQQRQDEKRYEAIQYIERMKRLGQLEGVKNTESYQIWLKWQQEKENATTN
ncbi:hypothetical protein ACWIVT_11360, partial [Ursidibacter arcticus]